MSYVPVLGVLAALGQGFRGLIESLAPLPGGGPESRVFVAFGKTEQKESAGIGGQGIEGKRRGLGGKESGGFAPMGKVALRDTLLTFGWLACP